MADTQDAAAQAAGTSTTAQAAEGGAVAAQATTTDSTATQAAATGQTVEELRAQLEREQKDRKDANAEAANMRKRLRELEAAEEERKKATMSEAERNAADLKAAQERISALEADRQALRVTSAIVSAATAAGIRDPQDAVALIDAAAIKFAEDGTPTNIDALVKALAAAKPYLTTAGASSPANAGRGMQPGQSEAELRAMIYGTGSSDVSFSSDRGGGVHFRDPK